MKILNNITRRLLLKLLVTFFSPTQSQLKETSHSMQVQLHVSGVCGKNSQIDNSIPFMSRDLLIMCVQTLQNVCMHLHSYISHNRLFRIPYISRCRFFIYNHRNVRAFQTYNDLYSPLHKIVSDDSKSISYVVQLFYKSNIN